MSKEWTFQKPLRGVWSHYPAEKWQDGFVAGNGEIGGVLFGSPDDSVLIGNHHRLFLKENDMHNLPDLAEHVPKLRDIIEKDGYQSGIKFFEEKALEKGYKGLTMSDLYHPAFQLGFHLGKPTDKKSEFFRSTDYQKGLVTEIHQRNNQWYKKEMFVSKEKKLIGFSISSNQKFDVQMEVTDFQHPNLTQTLETKEDYILQRSEYNDETFYTNTVNWHSDEGKAKKTESGLNFEQVKKVDFLIDISVNNNGNMISNWNFEHLKKEHIHSHQMRYDAVRLNLVNGEERYRSIDEIIEEMEQTKTVPLVLYEKMYDASRYVLHAASGKALPNLQGIWSGDFSPAWSGDYTLDTNVELAISSLNSLGMSDHLEGFFSQMKEYESDFEENAMKYFGCRGFLVPVHASTTAKHVHWNSEWPLVFWLSGAGWLAHFYQEYVDYTQDETFLAEVALPFYEKTILFYEDFIQMKEGKALIQPSYSAENGMGDNSTMDVAVLKEVIMNLLSGYEKLDISVPEKYKQLYDALPKYAINDEGVLKEWIDSKKEENYNHRHFSQFYPIFQSKEITKEKEFLWNAAQKGFDKKMSAWLLNEEGETSSSHGRMHAAMCAISLERSNDLEDAINELLLNGAMYDSLVTSHYNHQEVFNVDANGALPKIYQDALLYPESDSEITLFKAMPKWLQKGSLSGVHLPGTVRVESFEWNHQIGKAELLLTASKDVSFKLKVNEAYNVKNFDGATRNYADIHLKKNVQKSLFILFD